MQITVTPGYVCKSDSKKHQARFAEHYKVLCDVEDELQKSIDDAKALFVARDELIKAEEKMRRRKLLQNVVRAAVRPSPSQMSKTTYANNGIPSP